MDSSQLFMSMSNLGFLVPAALFAAFGDYFDAILQVCVFAASFCYHSCYRNNLFQMEICHFSTTQVLLLLHIDLFFSNVASFNYLMRLLPHKGNFNIKFPLVICSAIVVVLVGILTNSYERHTFNHDSSLYMMGAQAVLFIYLYLLNVFLFLDRKEPLLPQLKTYYTTFFRTTYLIISLSLLAVGLTVWTLLQRLTTIVYEDLHPFWHIIMTVALIFLIISIRRKIKSLAL